MTARGGGERALSHRPVLLGDVLELLEPGPGETFVDMTVGLGGHAEAVLEAAGPSSRLIGIDRDPVALEAASRRLARFGGQVTLVAGRFSRLSQHLDRCGVTRVDGVVADLGVSSPQLDCPERGFSFLRDGPLDMRMDPGEGRTAADIVNLFAEEELASLFSGYGEERHARRVARAIVRERARRPLRTTGDLADLVVRVVARGSRRRQRQRIHPATRVFQALRIVVNDELGELERGLEAAYGRLSRGGRLVVIAFHSLEDRIVKRFLVGHSGRCRCPREQLVCTCSAERTLQILTSRPRRAGAEDVRSNPRARSAKLRAARKLV